MNDKGTDMASTRYMRVDQTHATEHDKAMSEAEVFLLNSIVESGHGGEARDYAEAYALIRGTLTGLNNVEVKSS